jgi:p21-activated kinase 1
VDVTPLYDENTKPRHVDEVSGQFDHPKKQPPQPQVEPTSQVQHPIYPFTTAVSQNELVSAPDSKKVTNAVAAPLIESPTMLTRPPKPRRQSAQNDFEVHAILNGICSVGDPTKLYRNLRKIGQGATAGVYTAQQINTNLLVAVKKMNVASQPKKDLVVNEVLAMKESNHKNIVDYVDSFLHKGDLWIIMEYMSGCSLMDIITTHIMTEGQMATVCKEV